MKELTAGERVPIEQFHISHVNVRAEESFGLSEADQILIANLRTGKIVAPFKVRRENDRYGVYVGRRRFLSKKASGVKEVVLGVDFIVEDVTDEEARKESLIENLEILRKTMNPIERAKGLNVIVSASPGGLSSTARQLGIPKSTLSEWLQVLKLSPRLQETMKHGLLSMQKGLEIVRLRLGETLQNKLAEKLETEGRDELNKELKRLSTGNVKRGIPKGIYEITRVSWDKRNKKERIFYETLSKTAEKKGTKVPEYIKTFLIRHVDEIAKDGNLPTPP